ncbi:putative cytosolic iron-sulfur protein assembly protein-like protein [Thamnocephalis sphaerospora]|uniref:Probable cytosolic iron-sulfur protein assembly protein 1 n=1 Tax=Thamnocephalis sphaerospora TaxID=78915 RepID=A0A4P9XRM8_9FUNG|nr:putative cytosolic iron-sulfur protein assembly protein-like protein [Thamnocephalis sphaerospora]|eukprot:RKP08746.1 putative cytosolic iron-sulfur protein assembly protein-like protein [Thamnocephalis sphaerospora]
MPTLELLAELKGHADRVWLVSWNPKRLELASCSGDKTVRVWAPRNSQPAATGEETAPLQDWQCVHILDGAHERTVRSVAYSPSARAIATASFDASTGIWEQEEENGDYECTATLEGHENEVKSVAWSSDGALLATCSRDKSVWIWEVGQDGEDFECLSVLQEHTQDVKMVAWHPKEELLISASYDDTIRVWREDDDDWFCASILTGHQSTVWAVDFDRDGTHIVSGSDDKTLKIWRREAPSASEQSSVFVPQRREPMWKCVDTASGQHERCIYSVSWSKVHGYIASASADNSVRIFKMLASTRQVTDDPSEETVSLDLSCTQSDAHGTADVNAAIWCPLAEHGHLLATAGDDGIVRIWRFVE